MEIHDIAIGKIAEALEYLMEMKEGRVKMKKVSVVVPCYNAVEYLDCCIEHLLNQTIGIGNIEIILVDDASTDDGATWGKIKEYEEKFPDIIIAVSLEQNMRQGGARNIGISYATGEYLIFCDADDWIVMEATEILYNIARKYDADVVEFRSKDVTSNKNPQSRVETEKGKITSINMDEGEMRRKLLMHSDNVFTFGCWNKIYKLSMIRNNQIHFVEHLICEEPSFTLPVRLYAKQYISIDLVLHFCLLSPNSTMRSNWDNRKWDNAKTWLSIMRELEVRGFLKRYYDELECMFFDWGYALSIRMLLARGYFLSRAEIGFLKKMVLELFPDILQNQYIKKREDKWNLFLKNILKIEITEKNIKDLNQTMRVILGLVNGREENE